MLPRAIFTEPALASVGLTAEQARASGYRVRTGQSFFKDSGRAMAMGETEGILKMVSDEKSGEILGAHILGPHADILIHEVVTAMYQRGTVEPMTRSIHIHPTLSEMVKDVAKQLR